MMSCHMGMPSMINGVEGDTLPLRNLLDQDFDEIAAERTSADYVHAHDLPNLQSLHLQGFWSEGTPGTRADGAVLCGVDGS